MLQWEREIVVYEKFTQVFAELSRGEASGITQEDLDSLDDARQRLVLRNLEGTRAYRDRLESWKLDLGLSPTSAVVPDKSPLVAFMTVFDALDQWKLDARRKRESIPQIVPCVKTLCS